MDRYYKIIRSLFRIIAVQSSEHNQAHGGGHDTFQKPGPQFTAPGVSEVAHGEHEGIIALKKIPGQGDRGCKENRGEQIAEYFCNPSPEDHGDDGNDHAGKDGSEGNIAEQCHQGSSPFRARVTI